ncbi:HNH endonuclease signature motif containing protein [Mycolicibacterium iranicum]|uniref:HNH endonuclease signature motif containing protein n=1 Tax=Mycolicibacterium iranicum TaxID=912594 RepID=UPI0004661505|nr:HNH endonuclease signature motif containing protein [Mycolicibacterium iranicum]
MSSTAASFVPSPPRMARLEELFDELSELAGQRNAIDGRIVDIVAEIDRDRLWGATGARTLAGLVASKLGSAARHAKSVVAIADRLEQFPQCVQGIREGRLSVDQVGVIAERAADGSDAHYAQLASVATVNQLRTAVRLEPRPEPEPRPEQTRSLSKTAGAEYTTWRIRLPHLDAAKLEAALASHRDTLVADWKRDHDPEAPDSDQVPPFPDAVDAFMGLVEAGWDAEAARRPHVQHTTVVVHVDVEKPIGSLHLGPLLTDAERQYLSCDATCEVWFERHGQPLGVGRATRTISRRLRRALEHRDRCCVVPGCGATRGLHAHHLRHWEDGGPTELWNLVLVCPFHHRAHHRGLIILIGTADRLVVTDRDGDPLTGGSLARPPTTPPPAVPPAPGPTGERAQWKWYHPFEPPPPTTN